MEPNQPAHGNREALSEEQREALMRQLCTVAGSICQLRQLIDTLLENQVAPAAIMVYSKLQWAAMDPIAYSDTANEILQRMMLDICSRAAARELDELRKRRAANEQDDFEPPQAEVRF